ncbi:MAG TPA: tetratricopeptide repeat protein [Chthoniobacterales bacterium]|nr:tetratricopeptide repeat protein [Chthoniobacterales bacterium]
MILSTGRVLLLTLVVAAHHVAGGEEASTPDNASVAAPANGVQSEIDGYRRLAGDAIARGNLELAETFYQRLLSIDAPDATKLAALYQMADLYEKNRAFAQTITVLEAIRDIPPDDTKMPELLLRLGGLYREVGAYQTAISRYYSVLNSALKISEPTMQRYKDWTQQAQFEIAETYFAYGDYVHANKFFTLLGKLELAPADKARALFRSAYCLYLLDNKAGAEESARRFLQDYSDTKYAPECRYLLARTLKSLNRPQEALDEVLALLLAEKSGAEKDPKAWIYWQEKAGNQIANDFYLQGDFARAITIYQALARLNNSPAWLWPVIYQMGLCFERLELPGRAQEAYSFITDESKKRKAGSTDALDQLVNMATWRSGQLDWKKETEGRLQMLLGGPDIPPAINVSATP